MCVFAQGLFPPVAQGDRVRIWLWLAVVAGGAVNPANPQAESEGVAFVMPNDVHEKLILGFDYKSKKMSIRRSCS